MSNDLPLLFQPISIRGVTSRNRIVASPMCQYHSDDGGPGDWQMMHLGRLATGGSGIVFGEETAVEAIGRKTYACAGLYKDEHVAAYRKLTDFIRLQGAVPAIQLGHAGRKASCHTAVEAWRPLRDEDAADGMPPWQGLAPSALPEPHAVSCPRKWIKAISMRFWRRSGSPRYEVPTPGTISSRYMVRMAISSTSSCRRYPISGPMVMAAIYRGACGSR